MIPKIQEHNKSIDYAKLKSDAMSNQYVLAKVPLADFEIGRKNTLKIKGKQLPITGKAYKMFLKNILGVTDEQDGFAENFKRNTDESTSIAMLSALKSGIAMQNALVTVVANEKRKEIVSFCNEKDPIVTNQAFLSIFEMLMNRYSSLKLSDFYVDNDGGITLNARCSNEHIIAPGEEFLGGLTFTNSPITGTKIGHNVLRLICSNGMTRRSDDISVYKLTTDSKTLTKLFKAMDNLNNRDFLNVGFNQQVERAMVLNASVRELNYAFNSLKNNSSIEDHNLEDFLGFREIRNYLRTKSVCLDSLTPGQKRNCLTNVPLWDVVNKMTDFGSHNYGFNSDFQPIQASAGLLFGKKTLDAENIITFN